VKFYLLLPKLMLNQTYLINSIIFVVFFLYTNWKIW